MTLVLAQVICVACGGEGWTRIPLSALCSPVQCCYCREMCAVPKPGIAIHLLPADSPQAAEWYMDFPEVVEAETVPCR